ncbi:hypothetical protein M4578_04135 [Salipiger sp. P9]|uniref:hypothetical protein n=1 Tax=Salipiger pentaromativorans TaxID=2943193 RepID=UPI002157F322|nr:hypothetical protein [Salipiger pentaromativorans]MCR8547004.1 hypothetical protein [Salipiger pentaromativorans]
MSGNTPLKSRLSKALGLFVSVPLSALPALAQDKTPDRTVGLSKGRAVGVRAIKGSTGLRVPGIRKPGIRYPGIRVPGSVGKNLPEFEGK